MLQWLLNLLLGTPSAALAGLNLAGKFRGRRPEDDAPGNWNARSTAYQRFQETALAASMNLQLMAAVGTPPRILGALWSWPAALRASRDFRSASYEAVMALHQIAMVGNETVFDAAVTVIDSLGRLSSVYKPTRGPKPFVADEFLEQTDIVTTAVGNFTVAARKDLQLHDKERP